MVAATTPCANCARKDAQLAIAVTVACLAIGGLVALVLVLAADSDRLHIPRIAVAVVRRIPDYLPDQDTV